MMSKYLYGASVQGIQGFIFETNKLKEIVGASDLVEWFCSEEFLARFDYKYKVKINPKEQNRSIKSLPPTISCNLLVSKINP